jgi:hypothetical protein
MDREIAFFYKRDDLYIRDECVRGGVAVKANEKGAKLTIPRRFFGKQIIAICLDDLNEESLEKTISFLRRVVQENAVK